MKPTNIKELRDRVLQAFSDLEEGKIDIAQATTIAKLNETIISGLKSEMQYSILTGQTPIIPFYNLETDVSIDYKKTKKLL